MVAELLASATSTRGGAEPEEAVPTRLGRGDSVDRYLVERTVGAGGMGVVHAAVDSELQRMVALKVLRPERQIGVGAVVIVPDRIPFFLSRFVESGIGKESEADDAARVAVIGTGRNGFPARFDFHARIFFLILERVGGTDSLVKPEAEAVRIAALAIGFGVSLLVVLLVATLGVPLLESRLIY